MKQILLTDNDNKPYMRFPSREITAAERGGDNLNPNLHWLGRAHFHFLHHQWLPSSPCHCSCSMFHMPSLTKTPSSHVHHKQWTERYIKGKGWLSLPLQVMTWGVEGAMLVSEEELEKWKRKGWKRTWNSCCCSRWWWWWW